MKIPLGTSIFYEGELIAELIEENVEYLICKGGQGGRGNKDMLSKRNPNPEICESGEKRKKMKKNSKKDYLNRDEVNEMIESALRRHNRRSTIISSVLGWILIGGYSFGLFQAVQNV